MILYKEESGLPPQASQPSLGIHKMAHLDLDMLSYPRTAFLLLFAVTTIVTLGLNIALIKQEFWASSENSGARFSMTIPH